MADAKKSKSNSNILELITAASQGDLATVQHLHEQGVSLASCDYDKRTPLHLASAEGRLETVRYLVEQGQVEVNPIDRFGGTPVSDAFRHRQHEVAQYLITRGGKSTVQGAGDVMALCAAAKDGDLEKVKLLVDSGVDISSSDYDTRTALHIAACEGQCEVAEYLLKHGANMNISDRWGNTPLQDALRTNREKIVDLFKKNGVSLSSALTLKNHPSFISSLQIVLNLLCEQDKWSYGHAAIPSDDMKTVNPSDAWYADPNLVNKISEYHVGKIPVPYGKGLVGIVAQSKQLKWLQGVDDLTGALYPPEPAITAGFKSGFAFPLMFNDEVLAVLQFMSNEARTHSPEVVAKFQRVASSAVLNDVLASISALKKRRSELENVVYKLVMHNGTFAETLVNQEVDWFFNSLGLPADYFKVHSPQLIANHVIAFMSAKLYAEGTKKPDSISYCIEESDYALYFCGLNEMSEVELKIEQKYLGEGPVATPRTTSAVRVRYYLATGTISASSTSKVGLYLVNQDDFVNPKPSKNESDIKYLASGIFLKDVDTTTREKCVSILSSAKRVMGSAIFLEEDATSTVVSIAFKRGTTHSFFSSLSELLKLNKLTCTAKFIHEFSNKFTIYRIHLTGDKSGISNFILQANFVYILPRTNLFSLVMEGKLTPAEAMYAYAASRFTFHFLNKNSEEWTQLWEELKANDKHKNRLLRMKRTIRSEAATEDRIRQVVFEYYPLIAEAYADFRRSFEPHSNGVQNPKPSINKDLQGKISRTVATELDIQILQAFLTFNASIVKTNFYKTDKAALAIQLNPEFITTDQYPVVPYSVIQFLGAEFRGFHVRFQPVSRGGLRLIISRNSAGFQINVESLFVENYNLAYTQQKKNKDIPEGGSKGTILLSLGHDQKARQAFKKYIDAMLDLLLVTKSHKHPQIVDHFDKDDYIFCGPDENTADLMDWACKYAMSRGYIYASAFTTGKSKELGGIPHDVYGMTTRGIHQYVIGLMAKKGLREEDILKVQTGGPDGDLGSNEILISKDKTKAVVDGSGVLYDPHGINREELQNLARKRSMVKFFDRSKLSKDGFIVLLEDKNVVLPDGFVVENGMNFRNSFHLLKYAACDFFVPCGGRPESISIRNVHQLFSDGKPIFKNVVEGANLFLTQEARLVLEEAGVPLFKDSSANKGGVTSSSLEVLAALSLSPEEHQKYMCVHETSHVQSNGSNGHTNGNNGDVNAFYEQYVIEVQKKIEDNAKLEFEGLWKEHQRTKLPLSVLSDTLSDKINDLNLSIVANIKFNEDLKIKILSEALPPSLLKLVGISTLLKRLPESYILAVLSAHLASRFIYEYGVNSNQFEFWQFMHRYN